MDRVNTSLAFETVLEIIRNGTFDDYTFPEFMEDVPSFQAELRYHINKIFNHNLMPTYYDVGMLLFIYQTTPDQLHGIDTWNKFKDTVGVCYVQEISNPDKIYGNCLCGQEICHQYWITSHSKYALLGSVCIQKNGGKLAEQMYIADHYNCTQCNISVSNHGEYFHQKLCRNCYEYPKSICVKCKKNLHCPNGLCSSCKKTYIICKEHPTVCLSIKRNHQCNECIDTIRRVRLSESCERNMMGVYDYIEQRWTRERLERERLRERLQRKQREKNRLKQEQLNKEWFEKQMLERVRLETELLEKARIDRERVDKELLEKERIRLEQIQQYKNKQEQARLEIERVKHENREKVRLYNERLEKDRLEKERIKLENREKVRLYNLRKK